MKRILCFGDSNTWGAIPGSTQRHPEDVRWTGVMQRILGEGYRVIEEGYNGRTTVFDDPLEDRLSGIAYFRPCLDSQSPLDLIILMLGTNDLKPYFGADAVTIANGLQNYLNALNTVPMAGERPELLLVSPVRVDPAYENNRLFRSVFGPNASERSAEYPSAFKIFAEEHGLWFMDAGEYAAASKTDGIHMDAEAHKILGIVFAQKVKEIIG